MATKKVRKFGRGGDILTGIGAGLAGYGLYKHLTKGKDEGDDKYGEKVRAYKASQGRPEIGDAKNDDIKVKKEEENKEDIAERKRAEKASRGQPEMGDAKDDGIVVKKAKPVATVVKKAVDKPVKKAVDKPVDKSANKAVDKLVDKGGNKAEKTDKKGPVFIPGKIASMDKGIPLSSDTRARQPNPVVSPYVRPVDKAVEADKKQAAKNVESSAKKPSQAFPINKAANEKVIQKAGGVRVDNKLPKGIDLKTGNKDVYGSDTTSVFQKRAAQERAEMEAKKARKAKEAQNAKDYDIDSMSRAMGNKKGGVIKKMASGGMARSSASRRGDGIAIRGKTRA